MATMKAIENFGVANLKTYSDGSVRHILTEMSEGSVLVVGHGGSLKATLCVLLRLPLTSFA